LPDNHIRAIAIDSNNIWVGTYYSGVAKFDGTNWTVYDTLNSVLPDNECLALAIGGNNIWIGSWGLVKFDGTNWTVYNTSNSGLPYDRVYALSIDGIGNLWIGTYGGGLAKFDGTNWTVYNTSNSDLPSNIILSLAIDGSNIWIGTWWGLAKFDGTNWSVYNPWNSGMPDNWVYALAIDDDDNIWIGTWLGGLAVYREGGVILNIEQESHIKRLPSAFSLSQNFPNPFNPTTTIKYQIPELSFVTLKVFDVLGNEITKLINKEKLSGNYEVEFDATGLPSGIYFYRLQTENFIETKKMILLK
jgi:ligand-binding sensor domain-containing protein